MSCVFISVTLSCLWGKGDEGDGRVVREYGRMEIKEEGEKEVLGTRSPPPSFFWRV